MATPILWWHCPSCKEFKEIHAVYEAVEVWTVRRVPSPHFVGQEAIEPAYHLDRDIRGVEHYDCAGCGEPIVDDNGNEITDDRQLLALIDQQPKP